MPQLKLDVTGMGSKDDAKNLVAKCEEVAGVKMANANFETGVVVVTYGDGFDEGAVKAAIAAAGFQV